MAAERIDDEEVGRRRVCFGTIVRNCFCHVRDFDERGCERVRAAADARTKIVCSVFARTADCHLDNHRGNRSQDDHQQRSDYPEAAIVVIAISAKGSEQHAQLRQHGNGAGDSGRNRHRPRVVIAHMSKFVADDASDLFAAEPVKKARRRANCRVLRISSRGERIRLRAVHYINSRHRQAGMLRQLLHNGHKFRRTTLVHFVRVVHREHEFVGVPVTEQVSRSSDDKRDYLTSRRQSDNLPP